MAGIAVRCGLRIVVEPERADVIVVNTCAFIESAKRESIETLMELGRCKSKGRAQLPVSAGCLSQRYAAQIADQMPEVTHWLGTGRVEEIERVLHGTAKALEVGEAGHFLQKPETPRLREPHTYSAYLKIADGCSRRCAFCAIPAIRGKARSRPLDEIVSEASELAASGVKEVCLVAQDTTAYGRDLRERPTLMDLLRTLNSVDGIYWIRLHYLYPDSITDRLLETMRDLSKVTPYIDAPIQHAGAKMLRRMRRGYGPEQLMQLINRIRALAPGFFLRTAVLVGHPGETEPDFTQLMRFLERAQFDHLGAFRYSDEDGAPSYQTYPVVSPRDSYRRFRRVMALGRRISGERNAKLIGSQIEVLVEGFADDHAYVLVGRHCGQAPEVDGVTYLVSSNARPGDIVEARVIKTGAHDLVAEPG